MARQVTKRKPKLKAAPAPRRSSNAARLVEEKHIGKETIDWTNQTEDKVAETLRHYGYFYDHKEGNKWASEWVKKNYTKAQYTNFRAAESWRTSMTVCSLCKMLLNGAKFEEPRMEWIDTRIQESIKAGKTKNTKDAADGKTTLTYKKTPADILKEKTSEFIGHVEDIIDMWYGGTYMDIDNYSVYNELEKVGAAYNTAKAITDQYAPLQAELTELTGRKPKKPDDMYEQLIEGYSHLTKKKQKEYLKLITAIINDAEKYMASKKAVRKTRKKKPTSISQQVSKVKYLPSSSEYQVASVSPDNLIGASIVYLFNVKTRVLTQITSSSASGIGVKGTTIINFDDGKCLKKKLRKPEEFIGATAKTTKTKMNKEFNALTTKASETNGRINADTIILKVFR